jgi:hypothetical protein
MEEEEPLTGEGEEGEEATPVTHSPNSLKK